MKDEREESPRKKQGANDLLALEGVKTEVKDTQDKYEAACREHEAIVEEKDKVIAEKDAKIAELEQRLYYAELASRDHQFYGYPPPHFYYADEKFGRQGSYDVPRLFSRRGRS